MLLSPERFLHSEEGLFVNSTWIFCPHLLLSWSLMVHIEFLGSSFAKFVKRAFKKRIWDKSKLLSVEKIVNSILQSGFKPVLCRDLKARKTQKSFYHFFTAETEIWTRRREGGKKGLKNKKIFLDLSTRKKDKSFTSTWLCSSWSPTDTVTGLFLNDRL